MTFHLNEIRNIFFAFVLGWNLNFVMTVTILFIADSCETMCKKPSLLFLGLGGGSLVILMAEIVRQFSQSFRTEDPNKIYWQRIVLPCYVNAIGILSLDLYSFTPNYFFPLEDPVIPFLVQIKKKEKLPQCHEYWQFFSIS